MAYSASAINWDNIVRDVDREFTRVLYRNLTALKLFKDVHKVAHPGIRQSEWRDVTVMGNVVKAMDPPAFSADTGKTNLNTAVIPGLFKDVMFTERDWYAAQAAGLDLVVTQEVARKMAYAVNDALLYGFGTVGPGPTTGLLNDTNILTVDNHTSTNWTLAVDVAADLAAARAKLYNANQNGEATLLMNPTDYKAMEARFTTSGISVAKMLPQGINPDVQYDKAVDTGTAFLVVPDRVNFDIASPYELAQFPMGQYVDPITKSLFMRWHTYFTPRVKHADAVVSVTFDYA